MADDMWVFGYGSLIWNPDFPVAEQQIARATDWHRSFCMRSIHHRGTVAQPGLVLALDEAAEGDCHGVAFRVAAGAEAQTLAELFRHTGSVSALPMSELGGHEFDLIINATSSGIAGETPLIPASVVNARVCCYDMFYQKGNTAFLAWCVEHGAKRYADGLGMLVGQEAHAVLLWHGILPDVEPVIESLKRELGV